MKVLQVHNRYRRSSPSGENRVVDLEAAALTRLGHTVEHFGRSNDEIDTWSLPRKALLPGRVLWSHGSYKALREVLRRFRPDVVHVHNLFPLLSTSVLHACREERVPVVTTLHNYRLTCPSGQLFRDGEICHACVGHVPLPAVRHGCYRGSMLATIPVATEVQVQRRAWRNLISAYICISQAQRERLRTLRLPDERVFVKANIVPAENPSATMADHDLAVMFAGRLDHVKGLPLLLEAWDRYFDQHPQGNLRLIIAGAGPLGTTVASWAQGRNDVEVVGLLEPEACRAMMRGASAVVVPSTWEEPFGLVVVEAMAAGVAVIAPAHGAFPELVVDGVEGRLFRPGDPEALADVFADLAGFPGRYRGFGSNGRATYQRRFNPEENVAQLLSIYDFAVANPI